MDTHSPTAQGLARSQKRVGRSSSEEDFTSSGTATSNSMSEVTGSEINPCLMLLPTGKRAYSAVRALRNVSEDG